MIIIPTSVWTGLVLLVLCLILIVQIMILRAIKRIKSYQPPEENPAKLHFKDLT